MSPTLVCAGRAWACVGPISSVFACVDANGTSCCASSGQLLPLLSVVECLADCCCRSAGIFLTGARWDSPRSAPMYTV
ncbi:hypothetical protein PR003_g21850 [Phytophthora rubi]|uniref:Uncharacterized protein n=1 Tax=Phytophthora rubi TaxID=129364 RepID=A0A6A4DAJ5_9STRA|nr:hypothetical protein PR002_g28694 [Phytophthora rubi]KAE8992933.1 hypothetical protein PR001_g20804 [Phytophthora rubi]KAE9304039.1 hypothetical protein PR003_g21850 [Phytophthora rubi]